MEFAREKKVLFDKCTSVYRVYRVHQYSGTDVLIRGMELGCINVPLHYVHLVSDLASGLVKLGVREQLPVGV